MTIDPNRDLSPFAAEALQGLLLTEPEPVPPAEPELLALLHGALPPQDRARVATAALRSPACRTKLIELHRAETRLRQIPVEHWDESSRHELFLKPVGEAFSAARTFGAADWQQIARSPERKFAAIRASLALIAANARLALSAPRLAFTRGEGNADIRLFVDLKANGTLAAQATPTKSGFEGRSAILEMVDPLGGTFPIATSTLQNGQWLFHAEDFGTLTGLPEGPLPNGLFRMNVENEESPVLAPASLWIQEDAGRIFTLNLVQPPAVVAGALTLVLDVPEAVREDHPERTLALYLPVGRHEILLGTWPILELSGTVTLKVRGFDLPEGNLPFGSMLKARLAPLEVS